MHNIISGRVYFDCFCSDVDGWPITMLTPAQVNDFMGRDIDIDEWILHVKDYIFGKQGTLISDKKLVFVIESQRFRTISNPSRDISVIVGTHEKYCVLLA